MDIYEYLKLDHAVVSHLFKQFEKTSHPKRQRQIILFLAQELLVHAQAEEQTFYKILENYSKSEKEAFHGEKEHEEIKNKVAALMRHKTVDPIWIEQVQQLKKLVTHHVDEEEGELFKKAKKVLSEEEAYQLKEKMHYLKQSYLRKLEQALSE